MMLALDRVDGISVVGMDKNVVEPFDAHRSGGAMGSHELCKQLVKSFEGKEDGIRIAKMRFRSQKKLWMPDFFHERFVIRTLKQNQIRPLILLRADLFELALSKYHGDGSGKTGHMQFIATQNQKFAPEKMTIGGKRWVWSRRRAIVHFRRLTRICRRCASAGLDPVILRYEQMLHHPEVFWSDVAAALGQPDLAQSMQDAFEQQKMRKVRDNSAALYDNYDELFRHHGNLNLSERLPQDLVFKRSLDRKLRLEGLKLRIQEWLAAL